MGGRGNKCGFTLIEMLVVLAIMATLLMLAAPRYLGNVDKAKEAVLKENLFTLREAIDKYYADTGRYPGTLDELVARKYLRRIPVDPITESNGTWVVQHTSEPEAPGIFDIRSGAPGKGRDGTAFNTW